MFGGKLNKYEYFFPTWSCGSRDTTSRGWKINFSRLHYPSISTAAKSRKAVYFQVSSYFLLAWHSVQDHDGFRGDDILICHWTKQSETVIYSDNPTSQAWSLHRHNIYPTAAKSVYSERHPRKGWRAASFPIEYCIRQRGVTLMAAGPLQSLSRFLSYISLGKSHTPLKQSVLCRLLLYG